VKADPLRTHVAIVDPFLPGFVYPGQRFWAYLYPRTITALSHRWSHPAFDQATVETGVVSAYQPPSAKLESEQWLKNMVETHNCPRYDELLAKAEDFLDGKADNWGDDNYLHFSGTDAHGDIPDGFWDHVGIVLGRKVPRKVPSYFSCSC
jgi:hypothetical protein